MTLTKKNPEKPQYTHQLLTLLCILLLVAGEVGEVSRKIKKIFRDKNGEFTNEDIAKSNIEKLTSRMNRGTISGNGDNR